MGTRLAIMRTPGLLFVNDFPLSFAFLYFKVNPRKLCNFGILTLQSVNRLTKVDTYASIVFFII